MKITTRSLFAVLLSSVVAIFLLGQPSQVAAQSSSNPNHEENFIWFLNLIGSTDTSQIFCMDEDNGSIIEAKVGQTITVMFNYPRINTADEKAWQDTDEKRNAWSYNEKSDQWNGWTSWATRIPLLKENYMKGYLPLKLAKEDLMGNLVYPNNNMNRLTDSDFNLCYEMQRYYPRWSYYDSFIASHPGTTKITFECRHKNRLTGKQDIIKKVSLTFHIT